MGLQDVLSASADAVEELRSSLEEESLSRIEVEGGVARFTVRSEDGTAYLFSATFLGSLLPCGASLSCSRTVQGLDKANGKLGVSSTLTRAVAAAGRCVGVDLDWVAEAEAEGNGSDEEMQDADNLVDSDAGSDGEEDELLREWSKRLVKVEKIERGIEEREACEEAAGDLDALQQRQIFDSRAAFRRLANELEEVFKSHDFNLVAEAAEEPDGLYRWHVTLGGFDPESPLAQDMREAGRRFGSSSVQLQLVFKRPLHPFYPPSVQLVSPRFQGPILSAVASHPLFSIKGWDPTRSARDALLLLKAFLEKNARVDFDSARNAAGPFAYLPVEVLLAKLEALTGTAAAAQSLQQYQGMYQMREEQAAQKDGIPSPVTQQQQPAKKQKAGNGTAAAWKPGVGYGHSDRDGGSVWDAKKAEAVQAARDRELGDVLEGLARELAANLAPGASPADLADCTAAVHQSCLAPYVAHQLSSASFQDMAARHRFYCSLLQCAEALCSPQTASLLSWHRAESCRSIASAIAGLESQVSHFVRVYKQAQAAQAAAGTGSSRGAAAESEEDKAELELANYLLALAVKVSAAAPVAPAAGDAAGAGGAAAAAAAEAGGETQAGAAAPETSVEEAYRLRLSPYRVRIADGVAANHKHREAARGEVLQPKLRARRVGRELASCESDLPVSASSSVFVVADEANSNLWKALITGPEGTPYCGGCFLFDIYFPPDYPRIPPRVDIRTTGGGSVRFNPNLYQDGKVCLSLLGTWRGGRGESWSAEYSTVLQVLISIQSLILVDEPWYNEPGYEQRADDANSNRYSAQLMPHTIKWAMLDQLQHGPEYFQHVIQEHFRLRGDYILGNCRRWVEWCREKGQAGSAREVEKQLAALEAELSKLKAQPS